jgi:hypothetical protein
MLKNVVILRVPENVGIYVHWLVWTNTHALVKIAVKGYLFLVFYAVQSDLSPIFPLRGAKGKYDYFIA